MRSNIVCVQFNNWFFVVGLPDSGGWGIGLVGLGLFTPVIVLHIGGRFFHFNLISLGGFIIPVDILDWSFVVLGPDSWGWFVNNELLGGFVPLVEFLLVWRGFLDVVVFLSRSIINVKFYSRRFIVVSPDNWGWLINLE